jgi:chemotaxis protein methyltransferase CheR
MPQSALRQIDPSEIVATLRENLLVLTEDLVVEYVNDRFLKSFAVDRDATIGVRLDALGNGQWDIPVLIRRIERILEDGGPVEDVEVDHVFEHIGRRVMRLNARKTVRPGNGSRRILVAIEDVTAESDAAAALERARLLSTSIVDTLREPLLVLDERLAVVSASRAFYANFRVTEKETLGRRLDDLGDGQWAIPALLELLTDVVPKDGSVEDFEVRHHFPEIGERVILLNARKVFRKGNHTHMLLLAMQDVTERRRLEAEREAALAHAGRLLEEINHRVMNTLAMIGGIIALEARRLSDDACQEAFVRMRARVEAIGRLYRTLSLTGSTDAVGARSYLTMLVEDLVASSSWAESLSVTFDIAETPLSTELAVPLGLVVNELVTNSLKYAYQNRSDGRLAIDLRVVEGRMELTVSDDGPGIDPDARVDSGLGQKLTHAFAAQLGGALTTTSGEHGTRHDLVAWSDGALLGAAYGAGAGPGSADRSSLDENRPVTPSTTRVFVSCNTDQRRDPHAIHRQSGFTPTRAPRVRRARPRTARWRFRRRHAAPRSAPRIRRAGRTPPASSTTGRRTTASRRPARDRCRAISSDRKFGSTARAPRRPSPARRRSRPHRARWAIARGASPRDRARRRCRRGAAPAE